MFVFIRPNVPTKIIRESATNSRWILKRETCTQTQCGVFWLKNKNDYVINNSLDEVETFTVYNAKDVSQQALWLWLHLSQTQQHGRQFLRHEPNHKYRYEKRPQEWSISSPCTEWMSHANLYYGWGPPYLAPTNRPPYQIYTHASNELKMKRKTIPDLSTCR